MVQSVTLGRTLYTYDRAAWVSTDALAAVVPKENLSKIGGYVIERVDPDTLRATYYRGKGAAAQAFFSADVRDGKVLRSTLLTTPIPLTAEQAALVAAREAATAAAIQANDRPCTASPFNTVVMPTRPGGPILVYLLSAQVDRAAYPAGGHFRVIVGADGKVVARRPYTRSCIDLALSPPLPKGGKPVGAFVSHLLDPVPTEIHVFLSYAMRMPLFVGTPDKRVWRVQGDQITPVDLGKATPKS